MALDVTGWRRLLCLAGALLLLLAAAAWALTVGRYPLGAGEIGRFLLSVLGLQTLPAGEHDGLFNLIVEIRLPRILAAVLIGAALAVAGASYQAMFRNPLVSPGLLGVLSGASFGAALGMVLQLDWLGVQALSFCMGLLAVGVGLTVGMMFGNVSIIMLVLGGVISSGFFSALLSIVQYLADPETQLPGIVYWLMGSLAKADLNQTLWLALPIVVGMAVLMAMGRGLDALSMGDDEARALGVRVHLVRGVVIVAATLISALTVSIAGMVGWVGLIIPHVARMLIGPSNAMLLPLSALLGGLFLLACDTLARTAAGVEIPIGILTELVGIPVFLLVLRRVRRGWT
jgi:iron complex transport system permease protein